jgi:hypothetical protein
MPCLTGLFLCFALETGYGLYRHTIHGSLLPNKRRPPPNAPASDFVCGCLTITLEPATSSAMPSSFAWAILSYTFLLVNLDDAPGLNIAFKLSTSFLKKVALPLYHRFDAVLNFCKVNSSILFGLYIL